LEIAKKSLAGVPLLEIEGDIDHANADLFDRAVQDCLAGGRRLLLDLTRCPYIDSGGLAVLLSLVKALAPSGWLGVITPNKNVRRMFQIVGLDSHPGMHLFESLSEAGQSLEAPIE
jgi:anti-sigma B factor antagonist